MVKFRYIPHTADMAFVGYGADFKTALENAALALLNVMLDLKKINKAEAKTKGLAINEKAENREDIVWYVLQDIVSKVDAKSLNAFKLKILSLKEDGKIRLKGRLIYKDTEKDYSLLGVKAVTPHGLEVKKSKRWSVKVVVDV